MSYTQIALPIDANALNQRLAPIDRSLTDLRGDVTELREKVCAGVQQAAETRLRQFALELAQRCEDCTEGVVQRAEAYLAFLKGADQ